MFGITAFAEAPFASTGGKSGIAAASGVAAAGAVGTPSARSNPSTTGVLGNGAVGSVLNGITIALTGVEAFGFEGVETPNLSGVQASGAVGTLTQGRGNNLLGVQASGAVGSLATSRIVALTGVGAFGALGSVVGGQPTTGDIAYGYVGNIGMGTRTVALSGVSANGRAGNVDVFYWTTIDDSETPNWQNVEMTV